MILLDTNILVYAIDADAPQHPDCRAVVEAVLSQRLPGVLFPQVLLEFMAIVTHRRRVERPLSPARAWAQAAALRAGMLVLDPPPAAMAALDQLVATYRPRGQAIFDLYLVAQMRAHGVRTICTENQADFSGITGIEPASAADVAAQVDRA